MKVLLLYQPPLAADVSIIKALDAAVPYTVGDMIQYTLGVTGPDAATNVIVKSIIPGPDSLVIKTN